MNGTNPDWAFGFKLLLLNLRILSAGILNWARSADSVCGKDL
jgi:hypothetical protein